MRLAEPPGVRSCLRPDGTPGEGGTWRDIFVNGKSHFAHDLAPFATVTKSQLHMLIAEIRDKLDRASIGQLVYGSSLEGADVEQMRCAKQVLEIRLESRTGEFTQEGHPETHHVRIYFTEPDAEPDCLIKLGIRAKLPGAFGLEQQDGHAVEMNNRIERFEAHLATERITMASYWVETWGLSHGGSG